MRLALISAELQDPHMQSYHVQQFAIHTAARFKLLQDEGVWEKLLRGLLTAFGEAALTHEAADAFLATMADCMQELRAPSMAKALVDATRFVRLQKKAVLVTAGFDEYAHSETLIAGTPGGLPDELVPWMKAVELVTKAARLLPIRCSEEWGGPSVEEIRDAIDIASFLFHRAKSLLRLHQAASSARSWLLDGTGDFEREEGFEVLDDMVDAVEVARAARDVPERLANKVDVEMSCITRFHLGKLYGSLGLPEQQAKRFREALELSLSMDPSFLGSSECVIDGRSMPQGGLFNKPWFRAVVKLLKQRQKASEDEAKQSAQETREKLLEEIKGPMDDLKQPRSLHELINHLATKYSDGGLSHIPTDVTVAKNVFMKALLKFHPDKQSEAPRVWRYSLDGWKGFCSEVTKVLNFHYEAHFKGM